MFGDPNTLLYKRRISLNFARFVVAIILPLSMTLFCQTPGYKYLKNYTYKEYDHHPQNWGMVQTKNGIIYVANHAGVLEYDGVSWRVIGKPEYPTIRSLAIDDAGKIFIGGKNRIGFLWFDQTGNLEFNSLQKLLPDEYKHSFTVWKIYITGDYVYFGASRFLLRWNWRNENDTVFLKYPAGALFACKGEIFVRTNKEGLKLIKEDNNGRLKTDTISGDEVFKKNKIYMLVSFNDRKMLIGTQKKGLYIYDGKIAIPFPSDLNGFLKRNQLSHGIRLSSGDFALATRNGGVAIMDPEGQERYIFDADYGLQSDNVKYIFQDFEENLWLCLDNGISKIEYESPVTTYDRRSNLSGPVLSVVSHGSELYAGTLKGLLRLESPLEFRLIPAVSSNCWDLLSVGDSVLAATTGGIFQVKGDSAQIVFAGSSYALFASRRHPRHVFCGTGDSLVILSETAGQWGVEDRFNTGGQTIRSIAEEKNGDVWLGTVTGIVFRISSPGDKKTLGITRYHPGSGLPNGDINVAGINGEVIFATQRGLYRFDREQEAFKPDKTLLGEGAGDKGSKPIFRIARDTNNTIWFHSASLNYGAAFVRGETSENPPALAIRRVPIPSGQVNMIYPEPGRGVVWFAGVDGLVRYDTMVKNTEVRNYHTIIRRVEVNGKYVYDGHGRHINNNCTEIEPLPFRDQNRNMRFEFAAPFFETETETMYRFFLEGHDHAWSTASRDTWQLYTNLDFGTYTFRVKAVNIYGVTGHEATYKFKFLLPWHRSWWAFLLYSFVLFAIVFLVVRWRRVVKLEREKQRLEQDKEILEYKVKKRTNDILERNKQLKTQAFKLQEQSEQLQEMDKIKSRFFANISHEFRTPLTLIMSPLEQVLSDQAGQLPKKTLNMMLRSSQRLLSLIDQLLELSRFDSGKVKLNAACKNIVPFFKGILSSFDMLAPRKKLIFEFLSDREDVSVYFDAPKMEQAVYNLLINAVKFTPPGGEITLAVTLDKQGRFTGESCKEGAVVISVKDTGIGISSEQMAHIFERFYQAEVPGERGLKGTGIGLAITKEIIQLHYGTIDVHSRKGKGTEFVIYLPMGCDHLLEDEIASPAQQDITHEKSREPINALIETELENIQIDDVTNAGGGTKTGGDDKLVVLVVEDNNEMRGFITGSLSPLYTVVEAGNGKQGIEIAKEIIPDLIVSDIMMPVADGYELCRDLKLDVKTSHIPIIMLTAKASQESKLRGFETGADDYITKPFNTQMLLARIKNLIDLRRQLQLKIQREKILLPTEIDISSTDAEFLKELHDVIEKNLGDMDLNIDTLCEKLYMARSTLYRKMNALSGEPPNQYIQSYRLKRAAQLLKENFGNVTEVAFEVGFSSPAYFSRCFKEKFNQSPSSFQASRVKT